MTGHRQTPVPANWPFSFVIPAVIALALFTACGDDGSNAADGATPTTVDGGETPTQAPGTPAPADPEMARQVFLDFVDAVEGGDLDAAWGMYIASVPGDLTQHNALLGCQYAAFSGEFSRMQNMFERIAPFTVDEIFGAASGSLQIELKLTGEDGSGYLATLMRDPPDSAYRLRFFNSGRVAQQPGVPDPFPSPEDPQGYCGIWTGPR